MSLTMLLSCQQSNLSWIALLTSFTTVQGWLDDPVHVSLGVDEPVPPGLQHRYVVVPAERKLAVLCRQIRVDLKE